MRSREQKTAAVFVMGDIGRSPRTANHALELSTQLGYRVKLIGQAESKNYKKIQDDPNIEVVNIPYAWVEWLKPLPNIIYFALRCIIQTLLLFYIFIIKYLQLKKNPPALPVLSFFFIYRMLYRRVKIVLDIHNFGYTLMYRTKNRRLLSFVTWYEKFFAKNICDQALTVSLGMAKFVEKDWKMSLPTVVYDKANCEVFHELGIQEKHSFFSKYQELRGEFENPQETKFTLSGQLKEDRPILLVSSTSYTFDERIEELFNAMIAYEYEAKKPSNSNWRSLILVITGSGPRKAEFRKIIEEQGSTWRHIKIEMIWFEADDYPKILGAADLGICLHYSSSGYDTPMKVIDMYGACLPVLAARYPCIGEVIEEGKTGELFDNEQQLITSIIEVGRNWEIKAAVLDQMRSNIRQLRKYTWAQEWSKKVKPIVQGLLSNTKLK